MPVFWIFSWGCLWRWWFCLMVQRHQWIVLLCFVHRESSFAFRLIFKLKTDSICFPDADRMEVETPTLNETTLPANEEEAFTLEPVAITRRHNWTTLKLSFNSQKYIMQTFIEILLHELASTPPETTTIIIQNIAMQRQPNQKLKTVHLVALDIWCSKTSILIISCCFFSANSEKKRGRRKRKLVVDQIKELTNESIREQLSDYSDLVVPFDMAPPTLQLMQWKESGGANALLARPCSSVVTPQIKEVKRWTDPRNVYHTNNESINSEH